jgi:thiamine-phosphate pyrophosphorylase
VSARALPFRVLVITDEDACRSQRRGVIETIARALTPVVSRAQDVAVLVRAKHRSVDEVRALCSALRPVTSRVGARLLVHTHVSLVNELSLDGAHLDAHTDVNSARAALRHGALLGASRHAGDTLTGAAVDAVDYVTLSPIFAPSSKRDDVRMPLGARALSTASSRPLVALGGIDDTRAALCFRSGASAVAVIAAVMSAHDPQRSLRALLDAAP